MLAAALESTATFEYKATESSDGYLCEYDSDTGTFILDLYIDFTLPQSALNTDITSSSLYTNVSLDSAYTDNDDTYYTFTLPSDIILTDDLIYVDGDSTGKYSVYNGYQTGTTNVAFKYYFVPQKDGNGNITYTVVMVFDTDSSFYINLNGNDIDGEMTIEASVSEENLQTDGSVVVGKDSGFEITIPSENINYTNDSGNITATVDEDMMIYKTVTKNSDGTVTYTIRILTTKGTGDTITIMDVLTNNSNLKGLDEDGLVSITVTSGTIGAGKSGSLYTWGEDALAAGVDITADDYSGSITYYYDANGNLVIVLPGLDEVDTTQTYDWSNNSFYTTYKEYYIQYTYDVDPDIDASYYVSNSAEAETDDDTADVTLSDTSTADITVRGTSIISKTGSYSNDTITWTITLGDGSTSLSGYTLTDDLFADLDASDLTITNSSGTAVTGTTAIETTDGEGNTVYTCPSGYDYAIIYDDTTDEIMGIVFSDTSTKYTITYNQSVTQQFSSVTYSNTADVTPDGKTDYSSTASVTVGGTASSSMFDKDFTSYTDNGDGTYDLDWTSVINIPESGIPSGTTITDCLEGLGHYLTYAQAQAIVTALKEAFGEDAITNIQFNTSSGGGIWYISDNWVSADNLVDGTLYYAFRFTTAKEIAYSADEAAKANQASAANIINEVSLASAEGGEIAAAVLMSVGLSSEGGESGSVNEITMVALANGTTPYTENFDGSIYYSLNTVTISYSTTANVDSITDSGTFNNTIFYSSSVYSTDSYTYTKKVVKYGINSSGNPITGNVNISTSDTDNTVEWVVKVVLSGDYGNYVVTDNLPAGVTLTSLSASNYSNSNNYNTLTEGTDYNGLSDSSVILNYSVDTVDPQTVKVNITDNRTDKTSDYTVYIKYTCSYTVDTSNYTAGTTLTESLANTVSVTADGNDYGDSDSETIYVNYSTTEQQTGDEPIDKDYYFDQDNSILEYSLVINPEGITYATGYPETDEDGQYTGEAYSDLIVSDVLTYYTYPQYGTARSVSLVLSSVKLYYATTDGSGNLVKGTQLTSTEYSWTYTEAVDQYNSAQCINTITLTVPNSTALIFEYEYLVKLIYDDNLVSYKDYSAGATNTATLYTSDNKEISTDKVENLDATVKESSTSASANGGASYTIYKVDKDNFSLPLAGAVFDLYVYDGTSSFTNVGSFTTSSTGYTGISGTLTAVAANTVEQDGAYLAEGSYYKITLSDNSGYYIPVDTVCYFVESKAPDNYKLDSSTKYYFYFGSSAASVLSDGDGSGYDSSSMSNVKNIISSHTEYITNTHSSEYYSEKTSLSVIKSWIDSEGNEYEKTDGSVSFLLYRIFTYADGTVGYSPDKTGASQSDPSSSGGGTSASTTNKLNVTYGYGWDTYTSTFSNNTVLGTESITVTNDADATVNITITDDTSYHWICLYSNLYIYDMDNLTSGIPTQIGTINYQTDWDLSTYTCTYTLAMGGTDRNIYVYLNSTDTSTAMTVSLLSAYEVEDTTTTTATTTTTTEASTEATTEGNKYIHIFNNDFDDDDFDSSNNNEWLGTYNIKADTLKASDGTESSANFFSITGNLSWDPGDGSSHGTVLYDVDGDGDIDTLQGCLKMESKTSITFTPTKDGYLFLQFNAAGGTADLDTSGNSKVVNGVNINGDYYPATNNQLEVGLTAGTTYEITKQSVCYLFVMSFTEKDITTSSTTDYLHSFNNGKSSNFYTISGTLGTADGTNYGTVTYNGEVISEFLKMGSTEEITFTAPEAGILYLVLTDSKGYGKSKTIGVTLDGVTKEATASNEKHSLGSTVYLVTTRVSAGAHTITRINSTEYQLYYIGYVPDDYANAEVIDYTPYSAYGEQVGDTYTLSYSNDWSWSSVSLPLDYVSDGTDGYEEGEIVGYYTYYVVEIDDEGNFITQYKNITTNGVVGISGGTMGIINQINDSSSSATHISVNKTWLDSDGKVLQAGDPNLLDSITVGLYAKVHVYDTYSGSYSAGTSYSWDSSGYSGKATLSGDSDGIFKLFSSDGGVQNSSGNVGSVTYDETTYTFYLKFDGSAKITVDSPATKGILSLVTANYSSTGGNDIGFKLTSPSGTVYEFYYSSSDDAIAWKSTDKLTGSSAVEYNATDDPTVVTNVSSSAKTDGVVVFTIMTDEAGEWTLTKGSSSQAYLFNIDFAYQYQYLTADSGIYVGTYTIDADNNWEKTVSSLPLYIYDEDESIIGYYSYYIEEISPSSGYNTTITYTMELSEIVTAFTLNTDNGDGTYLVDITFADKLSGTESTSTATCTDIIYGDIDNPSKITAVTIKPSSAYASYMAITKGSVGVVNQVKEEDIVLPATGGDSGFKYILAGVLTSLSAILLLYKRRKGLSAGL